MTGTNRQARRNENGIWQSYGNVTIEEAAIKHARSFVDGPQLIHVRDTDNPDHIYPVTVERVVEYRATKLRGGA